jgi:hypothetical protein
LNSGTLAIIVTNTDAVVAISVDNRQGLIASTMVDTNRNFEIQGLPARIYSIIATQNSDTTPRYQVIIIENIEISVGSVNTLETLTLMESLKSRKVLKKMAILGLSLFFNQSLTATNKLFQHFAGS